MRMKNYWILISLLVAAIFVFHMAVFLGNKLADFVISLL